MRKDQLIKLSQAQMQKSSERTIVAAMKRVRRLSKLAENAETADEREHYKRKIDQVVEITTKAVADAKKRIEKLKL